MDKEWQIQAGQLAFFGGVAGCYMTSTQLWWATGVSGVATSILLTYGAKKDKSLPAAPALLVLATAMTGLAWKQLPSDVLNLARSLRACEAGAALDALRNISFISSMAFPAAINCGRLGVGLWKGEAEAREQQYWWSSFGPIWQASHLVGGKVPTLTISRSDLRPEMLPLLQANKHSEFAFPLDLLLEHWQTILRPQSQKLILKQAIPEWTDQQLVQLIHQVEEDPQLLGTVKKRINEVHRSYVWEALLDKAAEAINDFSQVEERVLDNLEERIKKLEGISRSDNANEMSRADSERQACNRALNLLSTKIAHFRSYASNALRDEDHKNRLNARLGQEVVEQAVKQHGELTQAWKEKGSSLGTRLGNLAAKFTLQEDHDEEDDAQDGLFNLITLKEQEEWLKVLKIAELSGMQGQLEKYGLNTVKDLKTAGIRNFDQTDSAKTVQERLKNHIESYKPKIGEGYVKLLSDRAPDLPKVVKVASGLFYLSLYATLMGTALYSSKTVRWMVAVGFVGGMLERLIGKKEYGAEHFMQLASALSQGHGRAEGQLAVMAVLVGASVEDVHSRWLGGRDLSVRARAFGERTPLSQLRIVASETFLDRLYTAGTGFSWDDGATQLFGSVIVGRALFHSTWETAGRPLVRRVRPG